MPVSRFLAGSQGDYELALTTFGGSVAEAFRDQVYLFPYENDEGTGSDFIATQVIESGTSHQFIRFADMPEAEEHIPGVRLEGQPFGMDDGLITIDGYVVAHAEIPKDQARLSQVDVQAKIGSKLGKSLARRYDNRMFRLGLLAARSPAWNKTVDGESLNINNGGNRIKTVASSVAVAYPVTPTGAKNFRDNADALAELMDNDDVPEENRVMYIRPYIRRVLLQDPGIFDVAFTRDNKNSMNNRAIGMVSGFEVRVASEKRWPTTNITTGLSKYRGNFAVGGTGEPVALVLCKSGEDQAAIGAVVADGIMPELEVDVRTSTNFYKASILMGADILDAPYAASIEVATT
jgi:hypothetical protein